MKRIISKRCLKVIAAIFPLVFLITFSSLFYGAANSNNTIASMALAFDKYLSSTDNDYVAAEFYSDNPVNPIRRNEFSQVSIYQNLWQLSKGPDNSLIRVYRPTYLEKEQTTINPLTIFPKEDANDDSGAISPIVYTGYDQDFRGDYLDIKIVKISDESKQINWSDFYRGGKMENYTSDTHSIMISEKLAKSIYASRNDVPIEKVTKDNVESLVGVILRSKMIRETGTSEALEREKDKPEDQRDPIIINSQYYSEQASRLKRVIGILDNESAKKYYPLIGDEFAFVVPTSFTSYDYFHPVVYGMFKDNLVGNRTSLLYFMAFGEFAKENDDYHLCFCNVEDGKLIRNGSLQANYEKCLMFFDSNNHVIVATIMAVLTLLLLIGFGIYLFALYVRDINHFKVSGITYLLIILFSSLISLLVMYLFSHFFFMGFYLPTMSIDGFITLLITNCVLMFVCLFMSKPKRTKHIFVHYRTEIEHSSERICRKTRIYGIVKESIFAALLGLIMFILVNVVFSRSSLNSVGIPCLASLIGIITSLCMSKYNQARLSKKITKSVVLKELVNDGFASIGILFGIIFGIVFGYIGVIWVNGIGFSVIKIILSFVASLSIFASLFWIIWFAIFLFNRGIDNVNKQSKKKFIKKGGSDPIDL